MQKPIARSLLWLVFLAPFFFISYGFANSWAAERDVTARVVFGWESYIPFIPWTIVPYWSIDLFYGLSFLLCKNARQVDRNALQLLSVQLISIACFILFPLYFSFAAPETDGLFGSMFDALKGFDKPYNQAPSLHIGLLMILWLRFADSAQGMWRVVVHGWSLLIGISVLTTYQHHFFDVPTGVLVGLLCIWLWPEQGSSPLQLFKQAVVRHYRLAAYYALAAGLLALLALYFGGVALWLFWPVVSLVLVALIYLGVGSAGFGKPGNSLAAKCLFAPYFWAARLNAYCWTRGQVAANLIADHVWLGKMPRQCEMAMLDLTAELPAPKAVTHYANVPLLDMVVPSVEQLKQAVAELDQLRQSGPVLVCCALGYSRSACVLAAWLLLSKRARSVDEALQLIRAQRPQIVLGLQHQQVLQELCNDNK